MYAICDAVTRAVVALRSDGTVPPGQVSIQVPSTHEVTVRPSWYQLDAAEAALEVVLDAVKLDRVTDLALATNGHILEGYPPHRQRTLIQLAWHADRNGLANRAAYIEAGMAWGISVLAWYYGHEDAITALATREAVLAYSWDFNTLPADPQVSIRGALDIAD